jgi:hypothetical protein
VVVGPVSSALPPTAADVGFPFPPEMTWSYKTFFFVASDGRHDTQDNDIQHNDNQQKWFIRYTQHKRPSINDTQHKNGLYRVPLC